jgi:uncharacterized coiled-coil protein SlyX
MNNEKLIVGAATVAMTVSFTLGGWVYAQGEKMATLSQKVISQEAIVEKHDKKLGVVQEKLGDMSGNVKVTKAHVEHIKKEISDIKQLLIKRLN